MCYFPISFYFIYLVFSHAIYSNHSLYSLYSSQSLPPSLSPRFTVSLFPYRKEQAAQLILTQLGITRCNKIKQYTFISMYRVRDAPTLIVRSPTKKPKHICRYLVRLMQILWLLLQSLSSYEPCWVDFFGKCSPSVLVYSDSYNLSSPRC